MIYNNDLRSKRIRIIYDWVRKHWNNRCFEAQMILDDSGLLFEVTLNS